MKIVRVPSRRISPSLPSPSLPHSAKATKSGDDVDLMNHKSCDLQLSAKTAKCEPEEWITERQPAKNSANLSVVTPLCKGRFCEPEK